MQPCAVKAAQQRGSAQLDCSAAVDMRDTKIAGIALVRHASIATRNVRHFEDLKVPVVNPWKAD
jgi:predicted nucleic acid-binding protein